MGINCLFIYLISGGRSRILKIGGEGEDPGGGGVFCSSPAPGPYFNAFSTMYLGWAVSKNVNNDQE